MYKIKVPPLWIYRGCVSFMQLTLQVFKLKLGQQAFTTSKNVH